ncbi:hypothetical protein F5Y06DRAFT_278335 [Hypoxylon sp. FL0890]|nr:hypothetical protein F5Y06DRAFT_278335 [Hypoxylon sp. FL0890]
MASSKSYSRLPASEEDTFDLPRENPPVSRCQRIFYITAFALSMTIMLGLGYLVGSWHERNMRRTQIGIPSTEPVGGLHYYMHFNGSFPQRSNPESDTLWDSLFPEKRGFILHPQVAPNVAGIAVFHELHCLNILRVAYFASLDGIIEEMGAESQDANHRTSRHHIRHCFEYLRQSLICLADANLEDMNYTTRGISGWQTERTCRDFEGLKSWAGEWGITREEALHNWDLQVQFSNETAFGR